MTLREQTKLFMVIPYVCSLWCSWATFHQVNVLCKCLSLGEACKQRKGKVEKKIRPTGTLIQTFQIEPTT